MKRKLAKLLTINGRKHIDSKTADVQYVELDNEHFIIPKSIKNQLGSALFSIDGNNNITHKEDIEGEIYEDTTQNKILRKQKQLKVRRYIDEKNEKYEEFFYSWEKCKKSDIWNDIIAQPNDIGFAMGFLQSIDTEGELIDAIGEYIKENNVCLATLNLKAKDNEEQLDFICLIGTDGVPISDLTCVNKQNIIYP